MEEGEEDTCGDGGADDAGNVGTHGVLEEVVGLVVLETHIVGHAGGIGHGADAGVADEGVDLVAFLEEEVHQFDEEDTHEGGDDEGAGTEGEDEHRAAREEGGGLRGGSHGDADEEGADVDDGVGGDLGEALGDAALLQQVTEEEHAQQGKARGDDEGAEEESDDGEGDLLELGDLARGLHADGALFLGGEEAHDGGLDDGHECHVGVGRDGDGTHELGGELRGDEDGRGAVGAADDADGTCLIGGEAEGHGAHVGGEDAALGGRADEEQFGVGEQGREVGHGSNAKEYQGRIPAVLDSVVEDVEHGVGLVDAYLQSRIEGDVADEHAESDGHKQKRLKLELDAEEDEYQSYQDHDDVAPCDVGETRVLEELDELGRQEVHETACC